MPPLSDEKWMKHAVLKARAGVCRGQTPFGACIVRKREILSCAHNGVWEGTDITAHAEIQAIRQACRKLKRIHLEDCVIYSTCEPCPMCFSACHWAKIPRIVYGVKMNDARALGFSELVISNDRMKSLGRSPIKIRSGVLRKENLALMQFWSEREGKKIY